MIADNRTTEYDAQKVLLIVIAALSPCFMMGVYVFGLDMLDNMLGGCGSAVLMAWAIDMARKDRMEKHDREPELLAAVITGALIVYGTPSTLPIWIVLIGVATAMIPARFLFDLLERAGRRTSFTGMYLLERAVVTAATALVLIGILFRAEMNTWPLNDFVETRVSPGDVATGMTPLGILAEGGDLPGLSRMFIGFISGPCGEVSVAAALIGGGYLIWKKIISPVVPACLLGTIFAAAFVYYMAAIPVDELNSMLGTRASGVGAALYMALYQVFAGGAVFGAFFMAPAICLHGSVSAPIKTSGAGDASYQRPEQGKPEKLQVKKNPKKLPDHNKAELCVQIICAVGAGFITILLRYRNIYVEGMALPVLIMYLVTQVCYQIIKKSKNPLPNEK